MVDAIDVKKTLRLKQKTLQNVKNVITIKNVKLNVHSMVPCTV